jgi:(p)ppGpp synthase/HD superfamily hydrolase
MEDINNWEQKFETCIYSDRLVTKLIDLNERTSDKVNIEEVKKAIYYARKYHGSQIRKSGEPYYSHPLEVAFLISDYLFRTDIIITAILHDTIEDTDLTKDMIEKIFGSLVANNVEDLTRIKIDHKISSARMLELLWIEKKYDILLIKLFDRLHNMQTISSMTEAKRDKIVDETIEYFVSLCSILGLYEIKKELIMLSYKTKSPNKLSMFGDDLDFLPANAFFSSSVLIK